MDIKKKLSGAPIVEKVIKYGLIVFGIAAFVTGSKALVNSTVTVSNSVDGRELPIYCVETESKKVALSFDAAWGNS